MVPTIRLVSGAHSQRKAPLDKRKAPLDARGCVIRRYHGCAEAGTRRLRWAV